jgi:hypothetical protein
VCDEFQVKEDKSAVIFQEFVFERVAVMLTLFQDFANEVLFKTLSVIFKFEIVAMLVSTTKLLQSDIIHKFHKLSTA